MTNETSPEPTLDPAEVPKDGGEARGRFGSLAVIKATAADTGRQMTIVDVTQAASDGHHSCRSGGIRLSV